MKNELSSGEAEVLESILDRTSTAAMLSTLAEIMAGKADHISENWQDDALARTWMRGAAMVNTLANTKTIKAIP